MPRWRRRASLGEGRQIGGIGEASASIRPTVDTPTPQLFHQDSRGGKWGSSAIILDVVSWGYRSKALLEWSKRHLHSKFGISLVDQVTKGPWGIVFASTRIDRGEKAWRLGTVEAPGERRHLINPRGFTSARGLRIGEHDHDPSRYTA